jgi:hypothetical protein
LKAAPVAPLTVPPLTLNVPVTADKFTALVLLVDDRLSMVIAAAPVVRLMAAPEPLKVTVLIVAVPKLLPVIFVPVVLPILNPRTVLF